MDEIRTIEIENKIKIVEEEIQYLKGVQIVYEESLIALKNLLKKQSLAEMI